MKHLGKVEWFGGYSNQKNKILDYGFIKTKYKSIFLHKKNIDNNILNSIYENQLVLFDIKIDPKNKKESSINIELFNLDNYLNNIKDFTVDRINTDLEILKNNKIYIDKYISKLPIKLLIEIKEASRESSSNDFIGNLALIFNNFKNENPENTVRLFINNIGDLLPRFEKLIHEIKPYNGFEFNNDIEELYLELDCLVETLNASSQINFLSDHYKKNNDFSYIIDKLIKINFENLDLKYYNMLPYSIWKTKEVWNKIDNVTKVQYMLKLDKTSKEDILEMEKLFKLLNVYEKEQIRDIIYFNKMFGGFEEDYFNFLHPKDKVEAFFNNKVDFLRLDLEAQLMVIYKTSQEERPYDFLIELKDYIMSNSLLHAACKILFIRDKEKEERKSELFLDAHNLFQKYVVERAWNLNDTINLERVLPICQVRLDRGVIEDELMYTRYCDCKDWPSLKAIYCPYERSKIGLEDKNSCAKFKPEISKHWSEWTFKELIAKSNIIPIIDNKEMKYEYTNKMSGWVNRLNQIRLRLRCSHCNQVCKPNCQYSKNLAKFNTTVITCFDEHLPGYHDKNIYLNQCWNCTDIIDSRYSKIQIGNYYLCLTCGCGPQNKTIFSQWDVCPKCGHQETEFHPEIGDICPKCRKQEAKNFSAGDVCPKCGDKPMGKIDKNEYNYIYDNGYDIYVCKKCEHIIDTKRIF